ncbi:MAG: hypothetical protein EOP45_04470 [Sphingobacteriaceae bacterium]|nr:MAG: hypothetical protein EOP45_04470 [Sphingobacteriaceae bacterium]
MNILTRKILSLLFAIGLYLNAYSQRQDLIGLNVNGEIYQSKFNPSIGVTFEKQFSKHNGFESGIFYRTLKSSEQIYFVATPSFYIYSLTVSERYLTVPVLYKYYSRILNFSAGPTANLYVGWKQKDNGSPVHIDAYDIDPKFKVGFLTKLSKVIPLNKQLVIEPELRFGSVETWNEVGLGIGIAGKYRF